MKKLSSILAISIVLVSASSCSKDNFTKTVLMPCPTPTKVVEVINPTTGKTWMDRNLGASRAAQSSTDEQAYGDLYQWGRFADGHQCRKSDTTGVLTSLDRPDHGDFILVPFFPYNWHSPENINLWQGLNGVNNPCPGGFRIPTVAELNEERLSWSSNDAAGAFASPLKLTLGGYRDSSIGSLNNIGYSGQYWSSNMTDLNEDSYYLYLSNSAADIGSFVRSDGRSVRCIRN